MALSDFISVRRRPARPEPWARPVAAPRQLGHRPILDGLRGAAWATVFVGHAGLVHHFAVGEAAMFVFFGLSGFLITSLLLGEHDRSGGVALGRFFARRALRLLPGLALFLVAWMGVVAVFGHDGWITTVPGSGAGAGEPLSVALQAAGAALVYLTNWFDIFHLFSGYVPLGHLWSLAVEEQLYLAWAPLLAVVLARARRSAMAITLCLIAASFADVAVVHHARLVSSWVYRSTDTRMAAFLVGGALALAWAGPLARSRRWAASTSGIAMASLGVLAWAAWVFDHHVSTALAALTWTAVSIAGPLLVVAVLDRREDTVPPAAPRPARPGSVLSGSVLAGSVLSGSVMRYVGRRSYALYLWHYVWLTWFHSLGSIGIVGALGASLVCAELSWRLVEAPCLALRGRFAAGTEHPIAEDAITRHAVAEHPVAGHCIDEGPGDGLPVDELPMPVPVAGG